MSIESVVNSLVEASKIMRDLQPVQWQFLEAPPDGSLFLTWQPLEYLDTSFASDGYIWADVEQVFSQEAHGYVSVFLPVPTKSADPGRRSKHSGIVPVSNLENQSPAMPVVDTDSCHQRIPPLLSRLRIHHYSSYSI